MNVPKVSVGLPVYNGQEFLEEALDSILSQDFEDFELIISDNASVDGTSDICLSYAEKDGRIRYFRNDINIGAAGNYNKVFESARGKYFKWATHDDVCLKTLLLNCVCILDSEEDVVLVYPRCSFVDARGNYLSDDTDEIEATSVRSYRRLAHVLNRMNNSNLLFGLIRSSALRKTRLIGSFIAADYVLIAELAMLGKIKRIDEVMLLHRLHSDASMYRNQSNAEKLAWFNPSCRPKFALLNKIFPKGMVRLRLLKEWTWSARRIPMGKIEKSACLAAIPSVYGVNRLRCYGGFWKGRIKKLVKKLW